MEGGLAEAGTGAVMEKRVLPGDNPLPSSPQFSSEREKLPEELRSEYEALVRWYRFYATVHHFRPFVSYKVLADLIRSGWRHSADPVDESEFE